MAQKSSACKPAKPYNEFPLFAHSNGQWAKKIRGKFWYFGKWEDGWKPALERYLDELDEIQAGRDPRAAGVVEVSEGITVADLLNAYLGDLDERKTRKEISPRHFSDCQGSCKRVVEHFGRRVLAGSLRAADFTSLRNSLPADWSPHKAGNEIARMKAAFRWGAASELLGGIPNFGPAFRKPNKREVRRAQQQREAQHGKLDFSASEAWQLVASSSGWLQACILLGLNAGFGAADCGRLRKRNIDFATRRYELPRAKTGIPRVFIIWQRTLDSMTRAMADRPVARVDNDNDLCFLSSHGRPVWWESQKGSKCDNVGKAFMKLCKKLEIYKPGRSFYSLRRTFETVGGNAKDQVAVNLAMGHTDDSTAEIYRQGIDDQRLVDVADHVERWFLSGEPAK